MTRNYLFLILLPFLLFSHNIQAQNSFAGVFQESNADQVYWNNASWDSFINKHKELRKKGYQMMDFEGVHVGKGKSGRFWGIWRKTNKQSRLQSRGSWEDFLKLVSDQRKEGYSLQDIESMLNRNGKRIYLGLFVKTGERAQFVQKYRSRSELFSSTENFKKKRKAYIIDFDPIRTKDGKYQFLAVYTQGSDKKARLSSHDRMSSFNSNRSDMKKEGLPLKDRKPLLSISIRKQDDQLLAISVRDNGIGRKAAAHRSKKLDASKGTQLVEERIKLAAEQMELTSKFEIQDLYDPQGEALETEVNLLLPYSYY